MKLKRESDDALRELLKEHAGSQPDDQATARLKLLITATYQKPESVSLTRNQWPARVIVLLTIVSFGLLLSRIGLMLNSPKILMILALTASIWVLIFLSLRISVNKSTNSAARDGGQRIN